MSDLTDLRDHARRMVFTCPPEDAALWAQIADEIDEYLSDPDDQDSLFS